MLDELDTLAPVPERPSTPPVLEAVAENVSDVTIEVGAASFDFQLLEITRRKQAVEESLGLHEIPCSTDPCGNVQVFVPEVVIEDETNDTEGEESQSVQTNNSREASDVVSDLPDLLEEEIRMTNDTLQWSEPRAQRRSQPMGRSKEEPFLAQDSYRRRHTPQTDMSLEAILGRLDEEEEQDDEDDEVFVPCRPPAAHEQATDWPAPALRRIGSETQSRDEEEGQEEAPSSQLGRSNLSAWRERKKHLMATERERKQNQHMDSHDKVSKALLRHHAQGGSRSVVPPEMRGRPIGSASCGGIGLVRPSAGATTSHASRDLFFGTSKPAYQSARTQPIIQEGFMPPIRKRDEDREAVSSAQSTTCTEVPENVLPSYEDLIAQLDAEDAPGL